MTDSTPPDTASRSGATPEPAAPSLTNPNLSAKLRADCEALQNDVQQARELAADFQRQLAGKSNEFAALKRVFQETRVHLEKLEQGIKELREERHRLANEAMRAIAFERQVADRDAQIGRLTQELDALKQKQKQQPTPEPARGLSGLFGRRGKS
jgi:septal ring factor EnvC (AmiA/AmiB activator)